MAAGLLFLRATLGLTILTRAILLLCSGHAIPENAVVGFVGVLTGALLMSGFLTIFAGAVVSVLCACALASVLPAAHLFGHDSAALMAGAMGISIALLGPGAYSVDARLFGPREIII